jgi:hypothetical protein
MTEAQICWRYPNAAYVKVSNLYNRFMNTLLLRQSNFFVLSYIYGSVTNNNWFWIG